MALTASVVHGPIEGVRLPDGLWVPQRPSVLWKACADPRSVPVGPVCFSFDVPPGRGSAVVASAGRRPDDLMHVEVVENRAGTEWVAERIAGLVERNATLAMTGRWLSLGASIQARKPLRVILVSQIA